MEGNVATAVKLRKNTCPSENVFCRSAHTCKMPSAQVSSLQHLFVKAKGTFMRINFVLESEKTNGRANVED